MDKNKIITILLWSLIAIEIVIIVVVIAVKFNKINKKQVVSQEMQTSAQELTTEPIEVQNIYTKKAQEILNKIQSEYTNEQKMELYNKNNENKIEEWNNESDEIFFNWLDSLKSTTIESFEEETATPAPQETPKPVQNKYYIKVNNEMNTVTVYTYDRYGEYTVPVKAMVCSTGYASPHNSKYQLKSRWQWGGLFYNVYGQYCTHITGDILFHSVPYLTRYDNNSLEYWEYDKLGTTASAGCVRLTVADAQWIFYNCPYGTWVEFYSDPNPGPLGKPTARKISDVEECRGWDPTDPNPDNPWRTYVAPVPTPETTPTPEPTENPSAEPTETPTVVPSVETIPSTQPSDNPTEIIEQSPTPPTESILPTVA